MTIYYAGDLPEHFTTSRGTTADTRYFDPDFASSAIVSTENYPLVVTLPNPVQEIWLHFGQFANAGESTNWDGYVWALIGDTGERIMILDVVNSIMSWDLYAGANSTSATEISTWNQGADHYSFNYYDVHVQYNLAASGNIVVDVYRDGMLKETGTVAITTNGSTGIQALNFGGFDHGVNFLYSEIILADEDTRGMHLVAMRRSAAGFHDGWTGEYADLTAKDQGGGITSNTTEQRQSWTHDSFTGPAGLAGVRLINSVFAYPGASGVSQIDGFLRISDSDNDAAQLQTPVGSSPIIYEWTSNPATGLAWDSNDLKPLEFGVRAVT